MLVNLLKSYLQIYYFFFAYKVMIRQHRDNSFDINAQFPLAGYQLSFS